MKRTPLFDAHKRLGGKLIEFGGWEMPVQYTSITDEHLAVRSAAGLFDISHMGEVRYTGPEAAAFLNQLLTNDISKLVPGQGQYTLMCNERGGVIDDLYAYRLGAEEYLLIINASRIDTDVAWMERQWAVFPACAGVTLKNISEEVGAMALQGPCAADFINICFPGPSIGGTPVASARDLKRNQAGQFGFNGVDVLVARTGYTGEDGFEIIAPAAMVEAVWEHVLKMGQPFGLKPAGLGARDTLRTEVCYPLYGHELDETITPIEAGVGFFVALDKPAFNGRAVMAEQKLKGTTRKLIAFKMTEKSAPPRPGYSIWSTGPNGVRLGQAVSGTQSPSLGIGIGLGYVPPEFAKAQTPIAIEIRGKRYAAVVCPKPIFKKTEETNKL